MGSFNLSFFFEPRGNFSNTLRHQKRIMRSTKRERVKVTATMSWRILTIAPTVLNIKNPTAVVKRDVSSEVGFGLLETGFKDGAFWFDCAPMIITSDLCNSRSARSLKNCSLCFFHVICFLFIGCGIMGFNDAGSSLYLHCKFFVSSVKLERRA